MVKIIIISAHPDDETLGAGGTLLKHKNSGDTLAWLIVTNIFENQGYTKTKIEERQREIDTVSKKYGFSTVHKLDYPTMGLTPEIVNSMIPKI